MNAPQNIMLYIKRAENHITKEDIIHAFSSNNVGIVSDIKFIKKTDNSKIEYNGVIVEFKLWYATNYSKGLLDKMNASADGTTKFTYDKKTNRYWFINVHKPQPAMIKNDVDVENICDELNAINLNMSDKERIVELEKLVKSMSTQLHYTRLKQEKFEGNTMGLVHEDTKNRIFNAELIGQLEDSKRQLEDSKRQLEDEKRERQNIEDKFENLKEDYNQLKYQNAHLKIDLAQKQQECNGWVEECDFLRNEFNEIKEELYITKNIMSYFEKETKEMKDMLMLQENKENVK